MTPGAELVIAPPIRPLSSVERKLPPADLFPTEYFPERIRTYVEDSARANGVPAGMVALATLAAAAGILGSSVVLEEKRGKRHFPSIWGGIVAPPGIGKTASVEAGVLPLRERQEESYRVWRSSQDEYERATASRKRSGDKSDTSDPSVAPKLEHLIAGDITVEALVPMLGQEPGILIVIDELAALFSRMDQYRSGGKGADRQFHLSLWSSVDIKNDRKSTGSTFVARPVASIIGCFQPATVRALFNGRHDGFSDRVLIYWPDVEYQAYSEFEVTDEVIEAYRSVFAGLYRIRRQHAGEPIVFALSPDARAVFVRWYTANQRAMSATPEVLQGFYAKLPIHACRIALVLHMLAHPTHPAGLISERMMAGAIDIAEALSTSTRRALDYVGAQTPARRVPDADRILRYLFDRGDWANRTDIHGAVNRNWSGSRIDDAISELSRIGAIQTSKYHDGAKFVDQWRAVADE